MFSSRPSRTFRRLGSTASLRLALAASLFFGLGGALFVGAIDFGLFRFIEAEARADLSHQMDIMHADATRIGGPALVTRLSGDARNRQARRYLFLVSAPNGQSFSNGLTREAVLNEGFHHSLPTKGRPLRWPDQRPNMLILSRHSADGTLLAIGRDTQHLDELRGGIRTFALWSAVGVIAIALIAGMLIGRLLLRRLENVNESVERIISGDASQRLPAIGFGVEFDELARNLNRMLARQEAALDALKNVSEGIAHDLRTPLGRLRNRLEELEADADDPEKRRAGIERAMQEIEQITSLFESLLALARLESAQSLEFAEPVDLAALIDGVGDIYRPAVEDAGGTLQIVGGASDAAPTIRGDKNLLMQALSNLVENAMVHANGGPEITIRLTAGSASVRLSVEDRGLGIPEEERNKVVRRFYRMDRSRSRPGSGLGLAMCAAVARLHGGALTLSDNGPGLKVELNLAA